MRRPTFLALVSLALAACAGDQPTAFRAPSTTLSTSSEMAAFQDVIPLPNGFSAVNARFDVAPGPDVEYQVVRVAR